MIRLQDVCFTYESRAAENLKHVRLDIAAGEFVLVCGASGSGKTSLLRILNKLIPAYFPGRFSGLVEIDQEDLAEVSMYELSQKAGSVFQNPKTQFFNVDTDSEIVFGLENRGVEPALLKQRLAETARDLQIRDLLGKSLFKLSGGQKQKIAFASVYAMDPGLYLLDEPSSNLDLPAIEALHTHLALLKAQGRTVVISEHRIHYVLDLADKIVYMRDGEIARVYTRREFSALSDEEVKAMGLRSRVKTAFLQPPAPPATAAASSSVSSAAAAAYGTADASDTAAASDSAPDLELRSLSVLRREVCLLRDLRFTAKRGDIIAVTGPNGIGKTSFLRALAGLHREVKGNILFEGTKAGPAQRIRRAYMVMQDVNYQLFAESVMAECRLGLKQADDNRIEAILDTFDLLPFKNCHPNTLSGGQKQRLAIAAGLICNKSLFILDEPTSGLDYRSMIRTAELLKAFAGDRILFIATHDPEFANLACNRLLSLDDYTPSGC